MARRPAAPIHPRPVRRRSRSALRHRCRLGGGRAQNQRRPRDTVALPPSRRARLGRALRRPSRRRRPGPARRAHRLASPPPLHRPVRRGGGSAQDGNTHRPLRRGSGRRYEQWLTYSLTSAVLRADKPVGRAGLFGAARCKTSIEVAVEQGSVALLGLLYLRRNQQPLAYPLSRAPVSGTATGQPRCQERIRSRYRPLGKPIARSLGPKFSHCQARSASRSILPDPCKPTAFAA